MHVLHESRVFLGRLVYLPLGSLEAAFGCAMLGSGKREVVELCSCPACSRVISVSIRSSASEGSAYRAGRRVDDAHGERCFFRTRQQPWVVSQTTFPVAPL